jgi:hypothetical protein
MDPIEKLMYIVIAFNVMAFCFGALFGLQIAKRGQENEQEKED